jgi:hypothetical protein
MGRQDDGGAKNTALDAVCWDDGDNRTTESVGECFGWDDGTTEGAKNMALEAVCWDDGDDRGGWRAFCEGRRDDGRQRTLASKLFEGTTGRRRGFETLKTALWRGRRDDGDSKPGEKTGFPAQRTSEAGFFVWDDGTTDYGRRPGIISLGESDKRRVTWM